MKSHHKLSRESMIDDSLDNDMVNTILLVFYHKIMLQSVHVCLLSVYSVIHVGGD